MFRKFSWFISPFVRLKKSKGNIGSTAQKVLVQDIETFDYGATNDAIDEHNWLFECAPAFHIDGNNVKVLNLPSEFYETLKGNISSAKKRITIASLYLGTGPLESALVKTIENSLLDAKKEKHDLKVHILLDHVRGSRGKHSNSRTMLLPLLRQFPKEVQLSFYHNPRLRGLLRWVIPQKFNETSGVTHLKVYLTDNTFILSGANLSEDYFTNRQDRSMMIQDSPEIADYLDDLVTVVSKFSLTLNADNKTSCEDPNMHPYHGHDQGRAFKKASCKAIETFTQKWKNLQATRPYNPSKDTVIFPLLQMGPLGITQDERVTCRIFESRRAGSLSYLATGYFNLTENYLTRIIQSKGNYNVLCAHPEANGFYKAHGIIGGIPDAFTQFAKEFYQMVVDCKQTSRFVLQEYFQEGWTFHVKGLWYHRPGEETPCLTMIGSPNFGHRSVKRDLENQVVLITKNEALKNQLKQECEHVYNFGVNVDENTFKARERRVPLWAWIVTRFTRSFF